MTGTRRTVKARELSKWGIAFGVILVVVLSIVRGFWPIIAGEEAISGVSFGMSQMDIILLGLFCISAWSPVYLSLWFDKFLGKTGGACGSDAVQ